MKLRLAGKFRDLDNSQKFQNIKVGNLMIYFLSIVLAAKMS